MKIFTKDAVPEKAVPGVFGAGVAQPCKYHLGAMKAPSRAGWVQRETDLYKATFCKGEGVSPKILRSEVLLRVRLFLPG